MKISFGKKFSVFGIGLYKEPPFVLAPYPIWVVLDVRGYLYADKTLLKTLWVTVTEWRDERHLIG